MIGKEIRERSNEFVVRTLHVFRNVTVDAVSREVVGHAFWIAVIPGVEIAFYKLRCSH